MSLANKKKEELLLCIGKNDTKVKFEKDDAIVEHLDDSDNEESVVEDRDKLTDNTPETRVEIYRELAEQKKEKEDRDKVNQPKERDYEKEQADTIELIRKKENEIDRSVIYDIMVHLEIYLFRVNSHNQ